MSDPQPKGNEQLDAIERMITIAWGTSWDGIAEEEMDEVANLLDEARRKADPDR